MTTVSPGELAEISATTAAYDRVAESYAADWAGLETVLAPQLERFAAALAPGALVVDVGCGPGRDLRALAGRGLRVVGLDRSAGMLRQARLRCSLPLIRADMVRMPLRPHAVDGLWLCASFLHVPKRAATGVLAELARVLRPGGVMALGVKQGDGEGWTETRGRRFFAYWQPGELDVALVGAGLTVLEAETVALDNGSWLWRLSAR
jgi:SAM-dependent methyltransferase